ncbi:FMN-dependent NADH-azoreductase [Microbacter sp. GSS18]|nr:FMN-dependent NADH-azoreductase [Microbacter sp. GSS18]
MSKLLVIRAHPLNSDRSRSMRLTDEFLKVYTEAHPGDDIIDQNLYEIAIPEIDLDLFSAWRKLGEGTPFVRLDDVEQSKITLFEGYTTQFLNMDKIVIANPLWNLQVPTRLKAWIDCITVAGKTFRYNAQGEAEGLVHGKKALHIQAAGGVFNSQDPASQYLRTMLGFIGIEDFTEIAAEGMDHDPARADDIMAAALTKVQEAAATF